MGLSLLVENDSRDIIKVGRVDFKNVQPDSNNILKFNSDNIVDNGTKDYLDEVGGLVYTDNEIEIEVLPDGDTYESNGFNYSPFKYVPNSIKINKLVEKNNLGKFDFINPEGNPEAEEGGGDGMLNPEERVNRLKSSFEEKLNPIKL